MKSCEWKGIKAGGLPTEWRFSPCEKFNPITIYGGNIECGYCGVDLSKPDKELEQPKIDPKDIRLGIYTIYWKEGGTSVAAIGMNRKGDRWIAPTNWIQPSADQDTFNDIDDLKLICVQED